MAVEMKNFCGKINESNTPYHGVYGKAENVINNIHLNLKSIFEDCYVCVCLCVEQKLFH